MQTTKFCPYCEKTKSRDEFRQVGAKCRSCHKQDRENNKDAINAAKRATYAADPDAVKVRTRAYYEGHRKKVIAKVCEYQRNNRDSMAHQSRNFRAWMGKCVINSKSADKRFNRPFNLTLDYAMSVLEKQCFRCAVTGLPLTHKFNDHKAASIDRINNKKGHVRGNIQIVCRFVNLAQQHLPAGSLRIVLDEYHTMRLERGV